jgi:16S rRNA (cytidine1402-2'-O)-methyltransferase
MPGTLYLIPNTLGSTDAAPDALSHIIPEHVQAITARLDYFVAENAKTARGFLKLIAIGHPLAKPLQEIEIAELNVNTPAQALQGLLGPLLAGRGLGVLGDKITVKPLVGPTSLLLAVMASGLNGQSFAFNGYLPTDAAQRSRRIKELETRSRSEKQTQLLIETPYRNSAMLEALVAACQPGTLICVATDLSLPTESIRTQNGAKWIAQLASGKAPDFHNKPTVFLLLAQT